MAYIVYEANDENEAFWGGRKLEQASFFYFFVPKASFQSTGFRGESEVSDARSDPWPKKALPSLPFEAEKPLTARIEGEALVIRKV